LFTLQSNDMYYVLNLYYVLKLEHTSFKYMVAVLSNTQAMLLTTSLYNGWKLILISNMLVI